MEFTKVQLRTLINNHLNRDGGLNDVMEWILNSLMRHERSGYFGHTVPLISEHMVPLSKCDVTC